MAEPSRRTKRVHGGLLPSSYPSGFGRDQSGFAALSRGFESVRTVADQITELHEVQEKTRVQAALNQAVRDEAAERRQAIADGSLDPAVASFESGNDLDFFVDDRVENMRARLADITTSSSLNQEMLEVRNAEILGTLRKKLQIQQVAAIATRVAKDQTEEANKIGADVGTGDKAFKLGRAQLEELWDSVPLSAAKRRELEVTGTTNLVRGGVTGAITRFAFDEAIEMIDDPDTIAAMSLNDREVLRARVLRAEKQHRADIVAKMGEQNARLVDETERKIDHEEDGYTDSILIDQDKRFLPKQKDRLVALVRDKQEWRLAVDRDLALRLTDPHSLPEARHKELDNIVFNKLYRETLKANPDMPAEAALRVADWQFVDNSGGTPAPSSYSRMLAALDNPTKEGVEYVMSMVKSIGENYPNLLAARADMDKVRSFYRETQIYAEMGIPLEEIVATRQAEQSRSPQQQQMIDDSWDLLTDENRWDDFDTARGQGWFFFQSDNVGWDAASDMRIRSTWATMYARAFQQTGSRKLATVRAASWLNTRWGSFSMSDIVHPDEVPPMEYPPDKFVQDFDKLGATWWYEDVGADLVELGHIRDTSPKELARVDIYVTDRTLATVRDPAKAKSKVIEYGVKVDGEVKTIDNGEPLHVGSRFPDSAHYKVGVQRKLDAYNEFENGADVAAERKKGRAVAGEAGAYLSGLVKEGEQLTTDASIRMSLFNRPTKSWAEDVIMQRELDDRRRRDRLSTEQSE